MHMRRILMWLVTDLGFPVATSSLPQIPLPFLLMSFESFTATVGSNENALFFGDDDCRVLFNEHEIDVLQVANTNGQALADTFVNYCTMTFASGDIRSCFRQDFIFQEVSEIKEELPIFRKYFSYSLFGLMLIFEF